MLTDRLHAHRSKEGGRTMGHQPYSRPEKNSSDVILHMFHPASALGSSITLEVAANEFMSFSKYPQYVNSTKGGFRAYAREFRQS